MGYDSINFNLRDMRPPPDDGVASITGLLDSIEVARESKRRFEMEQARMRAAQEETARHNMAEEAYNQQSKAQALEIHRQTMAKEQARLGFDQQKEANAHFGDVQKPLDMGDVSTAQMNAGRYGMGVQPDQAAIEQQAEQARAQRELEGRQQRGAETADALSPVPIMGSLMGPTGYGDNLRAGVGVEPTPAELQPTPEELHPANPPVQINMPAGPALDYDPAGARQKRAEERGRVQQNYMDSEQANLDVSPNMKKALTIVANQMGGEGFTGDPHKIARDLAQRMDEADARVLAAKESAQSRLEPRPTSPAAQARLNIAGYTKVTHDLETQKAAMAALTKNGQHIRKVAALANSDTGLGQATAIEGLLREAKGGVMTGQNLGYGMNHLGGIVDRAITAWETAKAGKFAPEYVVNLRKVLGEAANALRQDAEDMHKGFVGRFYDTPQYSDFQDNVDRFHEQVFGPLGYKTDHHPDTPGMKPTGVPYRTRGDGGPVDIIPPGGAPASGPGGGAPAPKGMPGGDDQMRVMPTSQLPMAAEAAGTGGAAGGPGDPALMTKARTKQMFEDQQAARAEKRAQKQGGGKATKAKSKLEILMELRKQIADERAAQAGGSR